jgi:hypothetical protein
MSAGFVQGQLSQLSFTSVTSFSFGLGMSSGGVVGGADHMLVACICWLFDPSSSSPATWDGVSMDFVTTSVNTNGSNSWMRIFALRNPNAGNLLLNLNWTNSSTGLVFAAEFSGISGWRNFTSASPIGTSSGGVTQITSPGDIAVAMLMLESAAINSRTQSLIFPGSLGGYFMELEYGVAAPGTTFTTFSNTFSGSTNGLYGAVDLQQVLITPGLQSGGGGGVRKSFKTVTY